MAQTVSDAVLTALAQSEFGRVANQGPATLYARLFYGATSGLVGGTEVSGGSYAAQAYTNNTSNFGTTGTAGQVQTLNAIAFPKSTAAWHPNGTPINCVRFYDAATGGTLKYGAIVSPTLTVDAANITVSLPANSVKLSVTST